MRLVIKFFSFPLADQWLLIRSALWISAVRLALRVLGFVQVRRILARWGQIHGGPVNEAAASRVMWAVDVVSNRLLRRKPCLTRALVAQTLLARCNYPTTLRIGVAHNSDGRFEAHAWLEHEGQIVVGQLDDLARFTPLPPLEMNRV
ncbi:MAG: lasso peptide biosynthesis B2 protein [Anaerolineae bacterium]|nr:lasso peptide biosynthesis B2 protein [Anaerolineae bacterium]